MRVMVVALVALLGACAAGGGGDEDAIDSGPSPFPVQRGQALPPPAAETTSAPPEGVRGGVDFGRWRQADPSSYAPAFQTQIRQRFAGQNASELKTSLEAAGFTCENERRLDCRIEIMERQCAFDWYVVLERGEREPVAGFEQMCLGANG